MPTKIVERVESYEVKYEVPGNYGTLLIDQGVREQQKAPDSKWPQAYIHVMAGGLDFNTEPFPVPTPALPYKYHLPIKSAACPKSRFKP